MRRPQHPPVVTYGAQAEAVEKPKAKGRQVIPLERAQPASDMAVDGIMAALAVVAMRAGAAVNPRVLVYPVPIRQKGPRARTPATQGTIGSRQSCCDQISTSTASTAASLSACDGML